MDLNEGICVVVQAPNAIKNNKATFHACACTLFMKSKYLVVLVVIFSRVILLLHYANSMN